MSTPASPSFSTRQSDSEDVRRELEVRRWALFPARSEQEIRAALESPRWNDRASALDAVVRDLSTGGQGSPMHWEVLKRALADGHVSVRTQACELASRLVRCSQPNLTNDQLAILKPLLNETQVRELAGEPFAGVRLGLVHFLSAKPRSLITALDVKILWQLLSDTDPRVHREALTALALVSDRLGEDWPLQSDAAPALTREDQLFVFGALFRAPVRGKSENRPVLDAVPIPSTGAAGEGSFELVLQRGLWAALALARSGRLEAPEALASALEQADRWTTAERGLLRIAARRWSPEARELFFRVLVRSAEAKSPWPPVVARELAFIVAESGPPDVILARALQTPEESWPLAARVELVSIVAPLVKDWAAPELEGPVQARLGKSAPLKLRQALVDGLVTALEDRVDHAAAAFLASCLNDPEQRLASRAFFALCGAKGGALEGRALSLAWSGVDDLSRIHRLERLSRAKPIPELRDQLLAFAAQPDERRAAAIELLALFRGDEEIRSAFQGWLEEGLRTIEAKGANAQRARGRCAALVRGLGQVDPVGSVAVLSRVLEQVHATEKDIAKAAVAALANSAEGLALLPQWLSDAVGRRTRVEAALMLLSHGGVSPPVRHAALERVIQDYDGLAWDLGMRVIQALGGNRDKQARSFLVSLSVSGRASERGAAAEALAATLDVDSLESPLESPLEALTSMALSEPDFELRRLVLGLLAKHHEGDALERIAQAFLRDQQPLALEFRQALTEDLWVALAACGRVDVPALGDWLELARMTSGGVLTAELGGLSSGAADFRWRTELKLARELAGQGQLEKSLESLSDRRSGWWELDGQLLLLLSQAAQVESTQLAFDLQRAALIACLGERAPRPGLLDKARLALMGRAWSAQRWGFFENICDRLLLDFTAGRLNERSLIRALGMPDRVRGIDPAARLASSLVQARAREALAGGALGRAQSLALQAEELLGFSRAAALEQAALERDLARAH